MNHDPLCTWTEPGKATIYGINQCQCDLIKRIRNDEQTKHANAYDRGYDQAVRDNR